ncbi:MAG: hypothetical protein PHZ02_07990 [Desulfocapsaceae bacterium]|nr:hypothetical protein [Desulfocapsaceae bacterium]
MHTNRRTSKRHATPGLISSIWNGESACIGTIEDVSTTGLRVSQIPSHFNEQSRKCFMIVHGPLQDFKLMLQSTWKSETKKEKAQMIGFKVVHPTLNWKNFLAVTLATIGVSDSSPLYKSRPTFKRRINNEGQDPYSIALFLAALLTNKTFAQGKGGAETSGVSHQCGTPKIF